MERVDEVILRREIFLGTLNDQNIRTRVGPLSYSKYKS